MPEIDFNYNPGRRVLRQEGDVPLPILADDRYQSTQEQGVELTDVGLVADAEGHKFLRPGTVIIPDGLGAWRVVVAADLGDTTPADGATDAIIDIGSAAVLKATVDMAFATSLFVGIYRVAVLHDNRMPSIADNAVMGLETEVRNALETYGFKFTSRYTP